MMRGTVYTVTPRPDGAEVRRDVCDFPVQSEADFKANVERQPGRPAGAVYEFGPITAPWRRV